MNAYRGIAERPHEPSAEAEWNDIQRAEAARGMRLPPLQILAFVAFASAVIGATVAWQPHLVVASETFFASFVVIFAMLRALAPRVPRLTGSSKLGIALVAWQLSLGVVLALSGVPQAICVTLFAMFVGAVAHWNERRLRRNR